MPRDVIWAWLGQVKQSYYVHIFTETCLFPTMSPLRPLHLTGGSVFWVNREQDSDRMRRGGPCVHTLMPKTLSSDFRQPYQHHLFAFTETEKCPELFSHCQHVHRSIKVWVAWRGQETLCSIPLLNKNIQVSSLFTFYFMYDSFSAWTPASFWC